MKCPKRKIKLFRHPTFCLNGCNKRETCSCENKVPESEREKFEKMGIKCI